MKKYIFLLLTIIVTVVHSQNALISELTEYYNGSEWVNQEKTDYSYDHENNLLNEAYYFWDSYDGKFQWIKSSTKTLTYNSNKKAITKLYKGYHVHIVTHQDRTLNTYNSNGKIIQILEESYENLEWIKDSKLELFYDNETLSTALEYYWNDKTQVFDEATTRYTLTYNNNGTISTFNEQNWNGTEWVTDIKFLYAFDSNNKMISQIVQELENGIWINDQKEEYIYDVNGNLISTTITDGDNLTWEVENSVKVITYDTSKLMIDYLHPFKDYTGIEYLFKPFGIVNKIVSNVKTDNLNNQYRTTYLYSDGSTAGIKDNLDKKINAYPNPTKGIVNLEILDFNYVEIYNILGVKVLSSKQTQVDLTNYVKGIYLFKTFDKRGRVAIKKIIKN